MSLRPDDRSSRARSRSRSGRERSRSRSNVRAPSPPEAAPRASGYAPTKDSISMPEMPGGFMTAGPPEVDYRSRSPKPPTSGYPYPVAGAMPMPYPVDDGGFTMGGYADLPPHERPGYQGQQNHYQPPRHDRDDDLAYGSDSDKASREQLSRHGSYASTSNVRYTPATSTTDSRTSTQNYQYADPPDKVTYSVKPQTTSYGYSSTPQGQAPSRQVSYSDRPQGQRHDSYPQSYEHSAYGNAQVVEVTPGGRPSHDRKPSKSHRLSVAEQSTLAAPRSPGLRPRMERLSVSGQRPDLQSLGVGLSGVGGGALPPPSPLLEAYHGTYQSLSPMPLALRMDSDSDLDDLPTLDDEKPRPTRSKSSSSTTTTSTTKKRVQLYDPTADAKLIASSLSHSRPSPSTLISILPTLTHDQILAVRTAYKKSVRIHNHGINLSKHIRTKFPSNLGKLASITALGRWESEGYWANFWYQAHASRRELLIESLTGRTNAEIRMIKDDFKDKRYGDDLVVCMEKELKMDKFRTAVLLALEARRQEEQDVYPAEYILRDVETLHRATRGTKGGESTILEICLRRSDAHLQAVLRQYSALHGENFARTALQRSGNLVGEVLAHVLNGAINKPARDAVLLQHAIKDIKERNEGEELRYELLISRLVRVHWDKVHLTRVKRAYWEKYGVVLEDAVEEATKGDFGEFCEGLCEGAGGVGSK
ncbi:unnamed protein product [Zymoseptoria tritici ST99CH_1E4]|uniref:Annexin n=1 Tax=Zymoseptoria tritici ST99CH_1E4 TaxID=1276532 RepID=A0A2H1H8M2_ZYMTR|nr:unnamed protein product [Zymoseptoria tritici ST99CH_1E4]